MSWDRKKRGASSGYFYKSVRVPGKPYPVKVYMGRGAAGHETAADVERAKAARLKARAAVRDERDATAEAEHLATELGEWSELLSTIWLVLTGHHQHNGCWRRKRG